MSQLGTLKKLFALSLLFGLPFIDSASLPNNKVGNTQTQHFLSASSTIVFPTIEAYEVNRKGVDDFNNDIFVGRHDSSNFKRINVSKNSDLLFGQVTNRDSALLLHCNAPYSVQWIFQGDSDPEFNTNTTTKMDSNGKHSYSAYLFMGSSQRLRESETGKYICTGVRNKKLSSYLYIFVTKSALFTNKGLETIYFTDRDASVRIPCSLSEPKAVATLQKSKDGVLKCPMSDSVRFDAKQGFILNLKNQDPEETMGTYLCIADYNNTFQIIKYDVMMDNELPNNSTPEQSSEELEQFPSEPEGLKPTTEASQQLPPPTTKPPAILDPPTSSCANKVCGENAYCRINKKGDSVCKCKEDYIGNPYVECKQKSEFLTTTTSHPPHHSSTSDPVEYSCESVQDCPNDRACIQNVCQDPCRVNPVCGPNTDCKTEYHTPFCKCQEGYEGDPYSTQQGQQCEKSYCNPNPCGPNTVCKFVNGIISCSCESGYATHNDGVCHPNQKTSSQPEELIQEKVNSTPRPLIRNRASTLPPGKECHYDVDCSDDRMCVQDKCEDPCINACGAGAMCHTRNHFPRCLCPEGTTGDPFYKCVPLFSEVLGTSNTAAPPLSLNDQDQKHENGSVDCGGENSPCGPNTVCQASRNQFVCVCPNNYFGDPYSSHGCRQKGYLKCEKDSDCPHFLACLRNTWSMGAFMGCVNPCNVKNVCKDGRSCVPFSHRPACLKTDHYKVGFPRDGLTSEKTEEADDNDELELNDVPAGLNNSKCFVRKNDEILSPCGKNAICFDDSISNIKLNDGFFCGCMEGYIGDPYVECEIAQPCTNSSTCREKELCVNGFCRDAFSTNLTLNVPESIIRSINSCSPSPCKNSEDACTIVRSDNSAKCLVPPTEESTEQPQSSVNLLRSDIENDEMVNDDSTSSTTFTMEDFTLLPPTATSNSYLTSAAESLEYFGNHSSYMKHFVDTISSNETSPPQLNDEEAVVDI